jgi:glycosyltransferase involved in cell wall biosynthesis
MIARDKNKKYSLSIVTPMYNESPNVEAFYSQIKETISSIHQIGSYEIICVNDGSTDDTEDKLIELNKKDSNVKIISFSRNFGQQAALTAGLDHASGDIVVPIDADLQDPPEMIAKMFGKWLEGYDVVYAIRTVREGDTWLKTTTAYLFYWLMSKVSGVKIPRNTGDFRLIDQKVVKSLKELRETQRFMKGLFTWVGYKSIGIEYVRKPRHKGLTKWNYTKLMNFAIEGITSFSYVPLKISFFLGIIISVCSFLYALFLIGLKVFFGNNAEGYTSIMVVVLFSTGVQLFSLGLIGEYIGRIYSESKHRPIYIVNHSIGFD